MMDSNSDNFYRNQNIEKYSLVEFNTALLHFCSCFKTNLGLVGYLIEKFKCELEHQP